ncbi:MAG: hypothetical protein KUG79_00255 [Pseudomonadales bacterium]|nr:hypothetical protein [Pseudomonadales bacterium]
MYFFYLLDTYRHWEIAYSVTHFVGNPEGTGTLAIFNGIDELTSKYFRHVEVIEHVPCIRQATNPTCNER